jgi:hypothetical protein
MSTIDIGTVLNKFDETYDDQNPAVKEFGIRFITTDGRHRTMRCRKGVRAPKQELTEKGNQERGKFRFNLKFNGTMLVHDLDIEESRAVKVASIFAFKDFNQTAWLRVYH